jgi:hypothetical protein
LVTIGDIINITIPDTYVPLISENAKKASLGGVSRIRGGDRKTKLYEDQLVGQLCHAAGSLCLTGSIDAYVEAREEANRNPHLGDNGSDLLHLPIDVKGSLMRGGPDPLDYRLLVRPRERHDKHFYVLALLTQPIETCTVRLVGWLRDEELPTMETGGPFRGAHYQYGCNLRPMKSLVETVQRIVEKKSANGHTTRSN